MAALAAILISTSCGSAGALVPGQVPSLSQVTTAEKAEKAVVILQDLRVAARDSVASYYTTQVQQGADPVALKASLLDRFEAIDSKFRPAWDILNTAAKTWAATGDRATFDARFSAVVDLVTQLQAFGGAHAHSG